MTSNKYFVYMARCCDNSLYTGYTNHVKNREAKHNQGLGAKYTRSRLPVTIVYYESVKSRGQALSREYKLKALTKGQKEALVKSFNQGFTWI